MKIPKIIHQIFEGRDGDKPSELLLTLAETWKQNNPFWEYRFWDFKAIDEFLLNSFPDFIENYHSFPHNVQRWDAIRYLILYKIGGLYVDLDYECLEPLETLLEDKTCCFGLDPEEHCRIFNKPLIISNAFMATIPNHPFFRKIIEEISVNNSEATDTFNYVLETTGPYMISKLYSLSQEKETICLLPAELISPLSKNEVNLIVHNQATNEIAVKIEKACAIHYFFGSWYSNKTNTVS